MTSSLASRLGDIPGVASVEIDLDGFGRGIDVRLEPDADEIAVMERLRALLAAYGIRHEHGEPPRVGRQPRAHFAPEIDVSITPLNSGARVEVATGSVKSFRIVAADPMSVAQGLADAWCQVIGRIPVEIKSIEVGEDGSLTVTGSDHDDQVVGVGDTGTGWVDALVSAVGGLLGEKQAVDLRQAAS